MAGAILSGAIFGDNLAPVSDVAIISAMTQTDKFGKPLDLGRVVKTRFRLPSLRSSLRSPSTLSAAALQNLPQRSMPPQIRCVF